MLTRRAALRSAACVACLAGLQVPAMTAAAATMPSRLALLSSPAGAPGGHTLGRSATVQILKDLRAAWQISEGNGVTIALVGQGVDRSTTGLTGKVRSGPAFGNPRGDSVVAGTIFAAAVAGDGPSSSNPFGTIGLAPGARILSLRVAARAPAIALEHDEARAIRYAASQSARVIYVDATVSDDEPELNNAVRYAQSKGSVLIASTLTYRSSLSQDWYPTSLPGVLGASSVILPGLPSAATPYPTSRNDSILVAAPGNKLSVTGPAGLGYSVWGGAAAAVWLTATAALVKSVFPHLPSGLVAKAIAVSARDRPRGEYNTRIGFGLINPVGALHAAARLAQLHLAARSGTPGAAHPSARLAAGPGPGPIRAVHHSAGRLAGYAGTMAAGLVLLAFAAVLAWRWCRPRRQHV